MSGFLIVRLGSLGDVIHGIPVAAALREKYPSARIDWMVDPRYVELLSLLPSIDSRISVDPRTMYGADRRGFLRTIAEVRQARYDAAIDLQGLLKSAVLARLAGADRTIGFPREHLREPVARFFYTETPPPGDVPHVVHKNLALLTAVGIERPAIRFPIQVPRGSSVDAAIAGFGRYALLNPGAAWPNKQWPPARFGSLARYLLDEYGLRSVVLWGPGERRIADAVVTASSGAAALSPPTSITDLVVLAGNARLMVSGDTGPLHIAAALGTPVVALFGPTYAERNGPWSPSDVTITRNAQCECHYERRCRRTTPCIEQIAVDEVTAAVRARIGSAA